MNEECEEEAMRHKNCVSFLGLDDEECLKREMIWQDCFYSKIIPRDLWQAWKNCEQQAKVDAHDLCSSELDEYCLFLDKALILD